MVTFQEFLELAESSTPERGKRRLSSRGPSSDAWDRLNDRRRTSDKSALKKAGFKRSSTSNYPDEKTSSSSDHHHTLVSTHQNQSNYTAGNLSDKNLSRGSSSRGKVTPTSDRVRQAKAIRKQMGGDRTSKPVHDVAIISDTSHSKNDSRDLISRGRSFKDELRNIPKALKKAGAKPGDKVTAEPAATMRGEDPKTGKQKRDKIYTKELGAKMNPRTGKTIGTMRR